MLIFAKVAQPKAYYLDEAKRNIFSKEDLEKAFDAGCELVYNLNLGTSDAKDFDEWFININGNVGIGSIKLSDKPTKLEGEVCPRCDKKEIWFTCYIGVGVANVRCHICGFEWIINPKTKLEIKGDLK